MSEPNLGEFPVLSDAEGEAGGSYLLERIEREVGMNTLEKYVPEVSTWYRLLTLQIEAFERGFQFDGNDEKKRAQGLRTQLLALGLTNSKAALDMLLVGYYSIAYAAIRHMTESWVFSRYVEVWPSEAAAFYSPSPGVKRAPARPGMQQLVAKLKKRSTDPRDKDLFERVYDGWRIMSAGSHPSGIGIMQAVGDSPGQGQLGAVFRSDMWEDGIRNGLTAAFLLVHETGRLHSQGRDWEQEIVSLGIASMQRFSPQALDDYIRKYGGGSGHTN